MLLYYDDDKKSNDHASSALSVTMNSLASTIFGIDVAPSIGDFILAAKVMQ